ARSPDPPNRTSAHPGALPGGPNWDRTELRDRTELQNLQNSMRPASAAEARSSRYLCSCSLLASPPSDEKSCHPVTLSFLLTELQNLQNSMRPTSVAGARPSRCLCCCSFLTSPP